MVPGADSRLAPHRRGATLPSRGRRRAGRQLLRATTAGVLDRALDMAAALEVRGYGAARQRARGRLRLPEWSRHDLAFLGSALLVVSTAVVARVLGWDAFDAYPSLRVPAGLRTVLAAVLLVAVALAPFADRRGIEP